MTGYAGFPARQLSTAAALAALTAALVAGCSSSGGGDGNSAAGGITGSLNVYAASSLTEAFDTIKAQFIKAHPGVSITITYGASSDLATQIGNGAPVDVFASAATTNMDSVKSAIDPTNFVTNTMEIAVPPSNPGKISSVKDLAGPGVKVAVCDPAVPCGVVAQKVFSNAGITVKPTASEQDVKSTLSAVESGEVDAGMVYVTDVRAAGKDVKGVAIPSAQNATTEYPIAALKSAKNLPTAKAFVSYVLSAAGKKVLMKDGFTAP
jgi:molybdate transport system substrate-binding protein